jgi:hypothetical protein
VNYTVRLESVNGNELESNSFPGIDMQYLRAAVIGSFVFSGSFVLGLPISGFVVDHVLPYLPRTVIYEAIYGMRPSMASLDVQYSCIRWGISLVVSIIVTALVVRRLIVNPAFLEEMQN